MAARERSVEEESRTRASLELLARLLPRVPVRTESDTIFFHVSADEGGRITSGMPASFDILVSDIASDDSIVVTMYGLTHRDTLVSHGSFGIGARRGMGPLEELTVRFPVTCAFTQTGTYVMHLAARSVRAHPQGDSAYSYRSRLLPRTPLVDALLQNVERDTILIPIVVEDTTRRSTHLGLPLKIRTSRQQFESAIGVEESVLVMVNNAGLSPHLRIVRGGGRLTPAEGDGREAMWVWRGVIGALSDTVTIEARLHRGAGADDLATANFTITPRLPLLTAPLPASVYAGEDLICDVRVAGLVNPQLYKWEVIETANDGSTIVKASDYGTRVLYHIPTNFAGKTLRLRALYNGHPYRFIDPVSHAGGPSTFSFAVKRPPTRIEFNPPAVVRPDHIFEFTAANWASESYRTDQPVGRLADVSVEISTESGRLLKPIVSMIRRGRFQFSFEKVVQDASISGRLTIVIRSFEAEVRRTVTLVRK